MDVALESDGWVLFVVVSGGTFFVCAAAIKPLSLCHLKNNVQINTLMKQNVCKKIETTKTNNVSYDDYEWVLLCVQL